MSRWRIAANAVAVLHLAVFAAVLSSWAWPMGWQLALLVPIVGGWAALRGQCVLTLAEQWLRRRDQPDLRLPSMTRRVFLWVGIDPGERGASLIAPAVLLGVLVMRFL